jgi:hypothetical protein
MSSIGKLVAEARTAVALPSRNYMRDRALEARVHMKDVMRGLQSIESDLRHRADDLTPAETRKRNAAHKRAVAVVQCADELRQKMQALETSLEGVV